MADEENIEYEPLLVREQATEGFPIVQRRSSNKTKAKRRPKSQSVAFPKAVVTEQPKVSDLDHDTLVTKPKTRMRSFFNRYLSKRHHR